MRYLVDSNVLLRLLQRNDPHHTTIRKAVRTLLARGDELCCAPQNIVELWNVSTRPAAARGGFGLTTTETDRRVRLIERVFTVLDETPAVYQEWRRLVVSYSVMGVQVHDARIVAVMNVHGLTHILTLNSADFSRYAGIISVSPDEVVAAL
ncbi:MAG: type II toxin-antitoxin system VapC family toxin [Acidobacteriota bacterium]|nr:type II toxin-antitoxin system VapC family toxin [Acidobacteriota bacterium]